MKKITFKSYLSSFPVLKPANRPTCTVAERTFVKQFGDKPSVVTYCGREDLVGLRVVGRSRGFRIEHTPKGRILRAIEIVNGRLVPTTRTLALRFKDSARMLVPGVRSWVQ